MLSYESARLSRNCSDWYPLLDVYAFKNCLIADRDGVYDPATPSGRMLLGIAPITVCTGAAIGRAERAARWRGFRVTLDRP